MRCSGYLPNRKPIDELVRFDPQRSRIGDCLSVQEDPAQGNIFHLMLCIHTIEFGRRHGFSVNS